MIAVAQNGELSFTGCGVPPVPYSHAWERDRIGLGHHVESGKRVQQEDLAVEARGQNSARE